MLHMNFVFKKQTQKDYYLIFILPIATIIQKRVSSCVECRPSLFYISMWLLNIKHFSIIYLLFLIKLKVITKSTNSQREMHFFMILNKLNCFEIATMIEILLDTANKLIDTIDITAIDTVETILVVLKRKSFRQQKTICYTTKQIMRTCLTLIPAMWCYLEGG